MISLCDRYQSLLDDRSIPEELAKKLSCPLMLEAPKHWASATRRKAFARRVELEMTPAQRADSGPPRSKRCPGCGAENALAATSCTGCGHEFPQRPPALKTCDNCSQLNPLSATRCQACGEAFVPDFDLTLNEALRVGAIVRGMELNETDVVQGESMAPKLRARMLASGDDTLVRIVKVLPEESWARLRAILNDVEPLQVVGPRGVMAPQRSR